MKTLNLDTTAPFQGLAELVAYNEGIFEKEDVFKIYLKASLTRK